MKKTFITLMMALTTAFGTFAQLDEGHITYGIDIQSDDPQMAMAVQMMQGSRMEMYFSGENSRTELNMGSLMTTTTIANGDEGAAIVLLSGMMGKKAIVSSLDDLKSKKEEEQPELNVELIDEEKEILSYNCKKAIVSDEDGNETVFWYTEEIKVNAEGQSMMNEQVPGFPLEFTLNNQGMIMTMTATELEDKIDRKKLDDLFDTSVPEGYDEMTQEQLESMGM